MKTPTLNLKLYTLFVCVIFSVAFMACEKEKKKVVSEITQTDCKEVVKSFNEDLLIECIDGYLYINHNNALVSCGSDIEITMTEANNMITIIEKENSSFADCICPIDISYKIGFFDEGKYMLVIIFHDEIIFEQLIEII